MSCNSFAMTKAMIAHILIFSECCGFDGKMLTMNKYGFCFSCDNRCRIDITTWRIVYEETQINQVHHETNIGFGKITLAQIICYFKLWKLNIRKLLTHWQINKILHLRNTRCAPLTVKLTKKIIYFFYITREHPCHPPYQHIV